jgi:beta-glucosidase
MFERNASLMEIRKSDFGADFSWGASAAAYQIEGAHLHDGKGPSIWDHFTSKKGKIYQNQHANNSCEFYHRYTEDLQLMQSMNIPNFRFSISWSRIFPQGVGYVNQKGVDFYHRLIDECLEFGIQPWITLYHWDLPHALELKGGWRNREILHWFSEFVSFCILTYGDKVKHWMILNEPMVFTGAGYFLGVHAPGKKGLTNFLAAAHHTTLCQAEGGRIAKSLRSDLKIGTTFSCSSIEPASQRSRDVLAAHKVDTLLNRLYIEPLLGLGYPMKDLKVMQRIEPFIKARDEAKLAFDMDFIGVQNYTREIVTHSFFTPLLQAKIVRADQRKVERTVMNWEVHPPSIYAMLKKYGQYKNIPELIVTENGAAFPDDVQNGEVKDRQRKEYLQQYIQQVLKAKKEGVNVKGYFVWSFTDNFEWAEGYFPRFGLVHVNYETQQRIIKDSGKWYRDFLGEEKEVKNAEIYHQLRN